MLEQLYSIVNARYEAERAIVATTNLEPDELAEHLGERTVSRLVEICGDPIPLCGRRPPPRVPPGRPRPKRPRRARRVIRCPGRAGSRSRLQLACQES